VIRIRISKQLIVVAEKHGFVLLNNYLDQYFVLLCQTTVVSKL